ncbi:hypothetical protein [Gordonia sp. CPCC 205333]|uniref:hypothetical protein n=1 Tax=Gordonia sp. CPCC 205333 TaxID=3140790 RepID=UPI003AF3DB72
MRVKRLSRSRRSATWLTAAVAALLGVVILTGCTVQTSESNESSPLVIGASSAPEMRMVAHIYRAVLVAAGTEVSPEVIIADDTAQLTAMGSAERDLFPAFSGRLLAALVPQSVATNATAASTEPAADFDQTYIQLNRSLPQGITLADPTTVTTAGLAGAASDKPSDNQNELSQQLVPVYRGAALNREQVKTINKVAGELTAGDLVAMSGEVARGADPANLAARWVVTHGLTH